MHSPQQIFSALQAWTGKSGAPIPKKAGDSLAGSSPGAFSLACIGFADILALPDEKTIHQSAKWPF
jgi:hypothetical protein